MTSDEIAPLPHNLQEMKECRAEVHRLLSAQNLELHQERMARLEYDNAGREERLELEIYTLRQKVRELEKSKGDMCDDISEKVAKIEALEEKLSTSQEVHNSNIVQQQNWHLSQINEVKGHLSKEIDAKNQQIQELIKETGRLREEMAMIEKGKSFQLVKAQRESEALKKDKKRLEEEKSQVEERLSIARADYEECLDWVRRIRDESDRRLGN